MIRIQKEWDSVFVAMSILIGFIGAYTTSILIGTLRRAQTWMERQVLAALASFSFAVTTVWSLHFLGMLAFKLKHESGFEARISYDPALTITSAVAIFVLARVAFSIAFGDIIANGSRARDAVAAAPGDSQTVNDVAAKPPAIEAVSQTANGAVPQRASRRVSSATACGDAIVSENKVLSFDLDHDDNRSGDLPGAGSGHIPRRARKHKSNSSLSAQPFAGGKGASALMHETPIDLEAGGPAVSADEDTVAAAAERLSTAISAAADTAATAIDPGALAEASGAVEWIKMILSPRGHTPYARIIGAGATLGTGVLLMHFIGMEAMRAPGVLVSWNPAFVSLTVFVALSVSTTGIFLYDRFTGPAWDIAISTTVTAAVALTHYSGMLAASYYIEDIGVAEAEIASAGGGGVSNSILGGTIAVVSFATSFVMMSTVNVLVYRWMRDLDAIVARRTAELTAERERSDSLLFNVLPRHIAERLRERGVGSGAWSADKNARDSGSKVGEETTRSNGSSALTGLSLRGITEAERFPYATVLFVDIVGFTELAAAEDARIIVRLLDNLFTMFDQIVERHHVTKIKTIGDAYMAAACLDTHATPHAAAEAVHNVIHTARAMQAAVRAFNAKNKSYHAMKIRMGAHTGVVIGGVIGSTRVCWDLWGDAVNLASRLESTSDPGHLHLSEASFKTVQQESSNSITGSWKRQVVKLKGKGEQTSYICDMQTKH